MSQLPASVAMRYTPPLLPPDPMPVVVAQLFRIFAIARAVADAAHDVQARVRQELEDIAARLPSELIPGSDGTIYLRRFLVADMGAAGRMFLQNICRSDEDKELHKHPRKKSRALILIDGYSEQRRVRSASSPTGFDVVTKIYEPGDVNVIDADTFHRLSLTVEDAWTIFIVGEKVEHPDDEDSWSFWDPITGKETGYTTFLSEKAERAEARAKYLAGEVPPSALD